MSVMTSVSHPSWVLGDETLDVAGCSPATVRQQRYREAPRPRVHVLLPAQRLAPGTGPGPTIRLVPPSRQSVRADRGLDLHLSLDNGSDDVRGHVPPNPDDAIAEPLEPRSLVDVLFLVDPDVELSEKRGIAISGPLTGRLQATLSEAWERENLVGTHAAIGLFPGDVFRVSEGLEACQTACRSMPSRDASSWVLTDLAPAASIAAIASRSGKSRSVHLLTGRHAPTSV